MRFVQEAESKGKHGVLLQVKSVLVAMRERFTRQL